MAFLAALFMAGASVVGAASAPVEPANAIRISCYDRGVYKVAGEDLTRLGIDLTKVDVARMALVHYTDSAPIYCAGMEDGRWDPKDAIYFFAEGSTQDTIPYINVEKDFYPGYQLFMLHLRATAHQPLRYKTVPMNTPDRPDPENYPVRTVSGSAHFESNPIYQFFETAYFEANKTDFIFWQKLTYPSSDRSVSSITLPFELPGAAMDKEIQLQMLFFAASESYDNSLQHCVAMGLNGKPLGELKWTGASRYDTTLTIPANSCVKGANQLQFTLLAPQLNNRPGAGSMKIDMVFLDWFNLRFKQRTEAVNDASELTIVDQDDQQSARRFSIRNFIASDILVFDLGARELLQPQPFYQITGSRRFAVNLEREPKPTTLAALSAAKAKKPVELRPITIRDLFGHSEDCNLLILTHPAFKQQMEPFLAWKRSRGLKARMTDIIDVFNEQTGGYASPWAMRQYIEYVYKNQTPAKLQYVLLVGDSATISKYQSYCPAYAYLQSGTHTNDNYFVNFKDPIGVPQLAVGRFSVSSPGQLANIIRKTMDYESGKLTGTWQSSFLLIAAAFEWSRKDAMDIIDQAVKPNLRASYIKTDLRDADPNYQEKVTQELVNEFNAGHLITVFIGHGGGSVWEVGPSFYGKNFQKHLFDQSNVAHLTNTKMPTLVFAMTCYTNDFEGLNLRQTLGETFVNSPGGAIAVVGASGRSAIDINGDFMTTILKLMGQHKFTRLGDYFMQTKNTLSSPDANSNYLILGDPSLEFSLPAMDLGISNARCTESKTTLRFEYALPAGIKAPARLDCFLVDVNEAPVMQWSVDAAATAGEATQTIKIVRDARLIVCLSDIATGLHAGVAAINPVPKEGS